KKKSDENLQYRPTGTNPEDTRKIVQPNNSQNATVRRKESKESASNAFVKRILFSSPTKSTVYPQKYQGKQIDKDQNTTTNPRILKEETKVDLLETKPPQKIALLTSEFTSSDSNNSSELTKLSEFSEKSNSKFVTALRKRKYFDNENSNDKFISSIASKRRKEIDIKINLKTDEKTNNRSQNDKKFQETSIESILTEPMRKRFASDTRQSAAIQFAINSILDYLPVTDEDPLETSEKSVYERNIQNNRASSKTPSSEGSQKRSISNRDEQTYHNQASSEKNSSLVSEAFYKPSGSFNTSSSKEDQRQISTNKVDQYYNPSRKYSTESGLNSPHKYINKEISPKLSIESRSMSPRRHSKEERTRSQTHVNSTEYLSRKNSWSKSSENSFSLLRKNSRELTPPQNSNTREEMTFSPLHNYSRSERDNTSNQTFSHAKSRDSFTVIDRYKPRKLSTDSDFVRTTDGSPTTSTSTTPTTPTEGRRNSSTEFDQRSAFDHPLFRNNGNWHKLPEKPRKNSRDQR
ncbi:hypothetical protein HK096_006329, partial [Nowakowskiella sp. JEL0078]